VFRSVRPSGIVAASRETKMTAEMTSLKRIASHLAVLGLLLLSPSNALLGTKNKKVARVKAGKQHKEHDPVHIIVNKVG
jgi:hypothetical protein